MGEGGHKQGWEAERRKEREENMPHLTCLSLLPLVPCPGDALPIVCPRL
jgi:hypothetical protein